MSAAEQIDLDAVADSLTSELPEPQQHAIDEARSSDPQVGSPSAELDAMGVPWNPEIHATGPDGKGSRNKAGTWKRRRKVGGSASILRGAPSAGAPSGSQDSNSAADAGIPGSASQVDEKAARASGAVVAGLMFSVCIGLGGPEWMPRKSPEGGDERLMMVEAWGDYFVANNITDIPPGWALIGACAIYALPRFAMPQTRARAQSMWEWIKEKVGLWWHRRGVKAKRKVVTPNERSTATDTRIDPRTRQASPTDE